MVMRKYAVVENGVVANVVVFDPEPPSSWVQSDTAAIGDFWDGQKFTRPEPPPIPEIKRPVDAQTILDALVKKGVITEADMQG